jgi:hypothetical protein
VERAVTVAARSNGLGPECPERRARHSESSWAPLAGALARFRFRLPRSYISPINQLSRRPHTVTMRLHELIPGQSAWKGQSPSCPNWLYLLTGIGKRIPRRRPAESPGRHAIHAAFGRSESVRRQMAVREAYGRSARWCHEMWVPRSLPSTLFQRPGSHLPSLSIGNSR